MKHLLIYFLLVVASSCSPSSQKESNGKLKLVTTTGIIEDIALHIVQDKMEVRALMGPGVDPHLYKATQGDLQKLSDADIVLYNGLYLEGKMEGILKKLSRQKPSIPVAEAVPVEMRRSSTVYQDAYDPHVWFDVSLWKKVVVYTGEQLAGLDSVNADFYRKNAQSYASKLDSLHTRVKEAIATIPENERTLITSHDAFGYFGEAYDIEVKGLQGISTVSDFGLKDITELVNLIVDRKIKSVFLETSVSERAINAVVEGAREKGHNVKIGGTLYSDALGEKGTAQGEYVGMVDHNVRTIVEALR